MSRCLCSCGKQSYPTAYAAWRVIRCRLDKRSTLASHKKPGKRGYAYHCHQCHQWHITSQPNRYAPVGWAQRQTAPRQQEWTS